MNYVCDGYVGLDSKLEVTLDVADPSDAVEVESEDEISEPEEDTIAGQMSALKGRPVKKRTDAESSDDESDTEGEEESESETDTDTETESDED